MEATTKPSVRTVESLGKVTYETKPNMSNIVAGFILGIGFFVGGLALAGYVTRQAFFPGGNPSQDRAGAVMFALIGVALSVGGVMLIRFARSLIGFRLRICAEGFWFTKSNRQLAFAWDEIVRVVETVVEEKLPLVKGPARHLMPTKTTRTYSVVRCDGETFYCNENIIPRTSLLAGPLSAAAKARSIDWVTETMRT
jgi:hypothetical protein